MLQVLNKHSSQLAHYYAGIKKKNPSSLASFILIACMLIKKQKHKNTPQKENYT